MQAEEKLQKHTPYDVFMLRNNYLGAFVLGFSLNDPWMKDFHTSRTPTVLYDNYISANPNIAYVGVDNNEGMELAVSHLKLLGHKKIGYLSGALGSHVMQVRHKAFFPGAAPERPAVRSHLCRKLILYHGMPGKASAQASCHGGDSDYMQP